MVTTIIRNKSEITTEHIAFKCNAAPNILYIYILYKLLSYSNWLKYYLAWPEQRFLFANKSCDVFLRYIHYLEQPCFAF